MLVKHPEMTEKNRAAHRRNGRKSRGAASAEGKERARAANLRHGIYSQQRDTALRALGEDPAELAELLEAACEQWRPANRYQQRVVEQLVSLEWRQERAARRQEHLEAAHLERVAAEREERIQAPRHRYVALGDDLDGLLRYVGRPDFYAPAAYLRRLAGDFSVRLEGGMKTLLEMLQRLGQPGDWQEAVGPQPPEVASDEEWAEMREMEEEEEDGSPLPLPEVEVEEGAEERAVLREELRRRVECERRALEAGWDEFYDQDTKPLTTAQRDVAVMSEELAGPMERLRGEEAACYREFFRLERFLRKLQERNEECEDREAAKGCDEGASAFDEPESEVGGPEPEVDEAAPGFGERASEASVAVLADPAGNAGPKSVRLTPSSLLLPAARKNAGASGDVDENRGG